MAFANKSFTDMVVAMLEKKVAHHCHARGCDTPVSPTLLMCGRHWAMVPLPLRWPVIRNYRRGQCDDKQPSRKWIAAARAAIEAVAQVCRKNHPRCTVLGTGRDVRCSNCRATDNRQVDKSP